MVCKKCGAKHNETIFCPKCGTPIKKVQFEQAKSIRKRRINKRISKSVILVGGMLLILTSATFKILSTKHNVGASNENDLYANEQVITSCNLNDYIIGKSNTNQSGGNYNCDTDVDKDTYCKENKQYNLELYYITRDYKLKKSGCDMCMTQVNSVGCDDAGESVYISLNDGSIIEKYLDDNSCLQIKTQFCDNYQSREVVITKDDEEKMVIKSENSPKFCFSEDNKYFLIQISEDDEASKYMNQEGIAYGDVTSTTYIFNNEGDLLTTCVDNATNVALAYQEHYVLDITNDASMLEYSYGKLVLTKLDGTKQVVDLCADEIEAYSPVFVDSVRQIVGLRKDTQMIIVSYANGTLSDNYSEFDCKYVWRNYEEQGELLCIGDDNELILYNLNDCTECKYDNSLTITDLIMNERYIVVSEYNKIVVIDKATKEEVFNYEVTTESINSEISLSFIDSANWLVINNSLGESVIWDENTREIVKTDKNISKLIDGKNDTYIGIVDNTLGIIDNNLEFYPITRDYQDYSLDVLRNYVYYYSIDAPTVIDDMLVYINNNNELIGYDLEKESTILLGDDVKTYLVIK